MPKSKRVVIELDGLYILGSMKDGASRISPYMSRGQAEAVAVKIPGATVVQRRVNGSFLVSVPEGYEP